MILIIVFRWGYKPTCTWGHPVMGIELLKTNEHVNIELQSSNVCQELLVIVKIVWFLFRQFFSWADILCTWLVVWLPFGLFSHMLGMSNHPNWRTHIFQRGGPTTNQILTVLPDHSSGDHRGAVGRCWSFLVNVQATKPTVNHSLYSLHNCLIMFYHVNHCLYSLHKLFLPRCFPRQLPLEPPAPAKLIKFDPPLWKQRRGAQPGPSRSLW